MCSLKWNVPSPSVTPTNHCSNVMSLCSLFKFPTGGELDWERLLEDASRVVSDEPTDFRKAQADCPHVNDIFSAIMMIASSQIPTRTTSHT